MNDQNRLGKNAKELDPQTKIYLLVAPGSSDLKNTVGFTDGAGEKFTFGFSTPEKAQAFVEFQKARGILGNMGSEVVTYWVTFKEYFDNPKNHQLCIDPPKDLGST